MNQFPKTARSYFFGLRAIAVVIALGALALLGEVSHAGPAVVVTLNELGASNGPPIASDFSGLSFGMKALLPDRKGGHFFSPTNEPLVTLFQNIGIHHLRLGGTTVEWPASTPIPGPADIDSLFAFARAAGVEKIIYSLRLLETNSSLHYAETNAAIARYIQDHYRAQLDCFALGNEPDHKKVFPADCCITNFSSYLEKWRRFATAITNAVPGAKFAGPDGSSSAVDWTIKFAYAQRNTKFIAAITEHFYVGGAGRGKSAADAIEAMLSPRWISANENLHRKVALPVFESGLPLRFTEASDHYSGGVPDASDTFAGALWTLDFLHWWAAHGACGVNFHNTQWVANDVITPEATGGWRSTPKGYGFKAFELGSHGSIETATVSNPEKINLTAYAVRGAKQHLVTLINKEYGATARTVTITIKTRAAAGPVETIYLTVPRGEVAAKTGITLGGAEISNRRPWSGEWTSEKPDAAGQCTLELPATSAVVIKIPAL